MSLCARAARKPRVSSPGAMVVLNDATAGAARPAASAAAAVEECIAQVQKLLAKHTAAEGAEAAAAV